MKADRCRLNNSYYIKIGRIKIHMDLSNRLANIINYDNMTLQTLKRIIHSTSKQYISKIVCKCDLQYHKTFEQAGFILEGRILGYFKGTDAYCMSYFVNNSRKICNDFSKKEMLIKECLHIKNTYENRKNNSEFLIRNANKNDIKEMAELFSTAFSTSYSPICDEEYLRQTINEKVLYKVAVYNGKIISIASANMDKDNLSAEITDCATSPCFRNKGVLSSIIHALEYDLKIKGFITLYSLSRAANPCINFVLSKHDYNFTGRLVNNYNIFGAFEDMNIWVKNFKPNNFYTLGTFK